MKEPFTDFIYNTSTMVKGISPVATKVAVIVFVMLWLAVVVLTYPLLNTSVWYWVAVVYITALHAVIPYLLVRNKRMIDEARLNESLSNRIMYKP